MDKQILKAYMKEHIRHAAAYLFMMLAFFAVGGLYGYDDYVGNMSYALLLLLFFGIIYGVVDYVRYRKKASWLFHLLKVSSESAKESQMPMPKSLLESLYQEIIRKEEEEKRGLITEYDEKRNDMADYYTMWTHQIKTPIAAMRLLLKEDRKSLEELFKVEQYAEMALQYARFYSVSSDFLFQTQDIYGIVKQTVKKFSLLFIGSGLSFTLEEFSLRAVTDEKWTAFVIEQVLSNALKYTFSGGIRIYGLNQKDEETGGQAVSVVIEDSGIGIRQEDLPRIFEKGFTGYNGRLDKKSTGIGLYLCRQIMDRLSHTIRVESEAEKGTRVILGFNQEAM